MTNKEKIAALTETYTDAIIDFYRSKRNAGITPTNAAILAACPVPTGLGDVEHEAFVIIVTVTQLVDADLKDEAKDVSNTVKSTSPEWERRRARLAEIETKAATAKRMARVKEMKAESEAAARQKKIDTHMADLLEQSRARQAVKAERAKLEAQLAAQEKVRMQSFPIPRG